jgi:hypothetical protein
LQTSLDGASSNGGGGANFLFPLVFSLKRLRATRYEANFEHNNIENNAHSAWGRLWGISDYDASVDWLPIFRRCCIDMNAEVGALHVFSNIEEPPSDTSYKFKTQFRSFKAGAFASRFGLSIPNIAWAMFFGPSLASKVDVQGIIAAGFDIEPVERGFFLKITDKLSDVVNDFSAFSMRRQQVRKFFPKGMFEISEEPPYPNTRGHRENDEEE